MARTPGFHPGNRVSTTRRTTGGVIILPCNIKNEQAAEAQVDVHVSCKHEVVGSRPTCRSPWSFLYLRTKEFLKRNEMSCIAQ